MKSYQFAPLLEFEVAMKANMETVFDGSWSLIKDTSHTTMPLPPIFVIGYNIKDALLKLFWCQWRGCNPFFCEEMASKNVSQSNKKY